MRLNVNLGAAPITINLGAAPIIVSAETPERVMEAVAALQLACNASGIAWREEEPRGDVVARWGPLITLFHARAMGRQPKDTPILYFVPDELLTAPEHTTLLTDLVNAAKNANATIVYTTTQGPKFLPDLSLGAPQQVLHYTDEWTLDRF